MQYRLEDALKYEQPSKYIVQSEEYSTDISLVPVLTAGKTFILGYTEENQGICKASSAPVILFDDFTADSRYIDFDFKVKSSAVKILHKMNTEDNLKYFYYAMQAIKYKPFSHKRVWISEYSKFTVKQRTPNEQNTIVAMLDKLENAIKNAKQRLIELDELVKSRFIEMFDTIDMSEERKDWIELEKISKIYSGTTPSTKDEENWNGDIPWITPAEMNKDTFYITDTVRKITEKGRKSKSLEMMPANTVLLSTRAPIGKVGITGIPMTCNQGFKNFGCGDKLNPIYLYILLKENTEYLNSLGSGTTFLEVSKSKIAKTKIPIPPIELQNTFAEFVKQVDKSKFVNPLSQEFFMRNFYVFIIYHCITKGCINFCMPK